jgi:hypothetical protein
MATVQAVFHLAQRQTEGFLNSVFCLMGVALKSPDTRPGRGDWDSLRLPLKRLKKARHVVVDSTGVKVYGEGEWKVRQHGWSKRRTWRKLHLCVDEDTQEIISACASTPNVSDGEMVPELLTDLPGTSRQVSGDGQYDQRKCYEAINRQKAQVAIPPRKGARAHLAARQHGSGTPRAG